MAIYEFYCPHCKEKFEKKFSIKDVVDYTRCKCGKLAGRKMSLVNFKMK